MLPLIFILHAILPKSLRGGDPTKSQLCVVACRESLSNVDFGTTIKTDNHFTSYCKDTLRWSSICLCSKTHCSPYQIKTGVQYISSECITRTNVIPPAYDSTVLTFSDEAIRAMPVIEYSVEPWNKIFNTTVLPSQELFHLAYKTLVIPISTLLASFFRFFTN